MSDLQKKDYTAIWTHGQDGKMYESWVDPNQETVFVYNNGFLTTRPKTQAEASIKQKECKTQNEIFNRLFDEAFSLIRSYKI